MIESIKSRLGQQQYRPQRPDMGNISSDATELGGIEADAEPGPPEAFDPR
ncbi:hypothetical protein JQ612_13730 [Bradyrhizobium manausense]|nr:hypothetical protein [Bradyrhizobium manausense]MBR0834249.1 hypothetical protein [Bradyrhizobium manausense]